MKIILTGSIAFDYLMRFPGYFRECILPEHLDKISLSFLVDDMVKQYGGVGANIAYTMALMGAKPVLFSTAGQDFPEFSRRLEALGVDTSKVKIIPNKFTASFFANTDISNAQISSFYTGAMADSAGYPLAESGCEPGDYVMISPTDPRAMERYIDEAELLGVRMLFDPGQQIIRLSADSIRRGINSAYGLFVNAYEFELMQSHTGLTEEQILDNPEFAVVTLGKDGSRVRSRTEEHHIPAVPDVTVVDPTGVGDAYRAGFIRGYMAEFPLKLCGEMGTISAALCIAHSGTQNHSFTMEEYKKYFRNYFDDKGQLDQLD